MPQKRTNEPTNEPNREVLKMAQKRKPKTYRKIGIDIVERKKGKFVQLTGKTPEGKIIRRVYAFDQIRPFDANRLNVYVDALKKKTSGEKSPRLTEKYVAKQTTREGKQRTGRLIKKTKGIVKQIERRPLVQDSIDRGVNQLKRPVRLNDLGKREKQNEIIDELLKPLVKHQGIRELLTENQDIWKKYLTYQMTINTAKDEGGIRNRHAQIDDANKTLTEYHEEYTKADYGEGKELWQTSTTTKVETDTRQAPIKVRTTMGGFQERIGDADGRWIMTQVLVQIRISKTKPRTLLDG